MKTIRVDGGEWEMKKKYKRIKKKMKDKKKKKRRRSGRKRRRRNSKKKIINHFPWDLYNIQLKLWGNNYDIFISLNKTISNV